MIRRLLERRWWRRRMVVAALDAAYRAYFAEHNIQCLLLPTFPQSPGNIDTKGYAAKAISANEYHWLFHHTSPSHQSHYPPVVFPGSMIPCSVLLYGFDDAELLGIARTLEEALGGVSDWAVAAFGGRRTLGGAP